MLMRWKRHRIKLSLNGGEERDLKKRKEREKREEG